MSPMSSLSLLLLFPSTTQLVLQRWQHLTRAMVIKPRLLVPLQPPCAASAIRIGLVDPEMFLDRPCNQLPQLWRRQHGIADALDDLHPRLSAKLGSDLS